MILTISLRKEDNDQTFWTYFLAGCYEAFSHVTFYLSVFGGLQVYEQDDLSEQMASLEGLMKQLNAITGSAF